MISFDKPWLLWLFLLLPLIFYLFKKALTKRSSFGFPSVGSLLDFQLTQAKILESVPLMLRLFTLGFLILAAARPLGSGEEAKRHTEGLDIMLVIDTSQSMLAMDFELKGERQDRLTVVKDVVDDFISKRDDDRIGLVVFGTEAFTQAPLTMDHQVLLKFLSHISIAMAGPETAIGDGLATAVKRLKDVPAHSKIVILLTDGENTAGSIDPLEAARVAATLGIRVYTIAVGSNEPVPFPVETPYGIEYRRQIFKVNAELLGSIAEQTKAQFFQAKDTEALKEIYATIDKLEKTKQEWQDPITRKELAAWMLGAALCFLLLEQIWLLLPWRVIP